MIKELAKKLKINGKPVRVICNQILLDLQDFGSVLPKQLELTNVVPNDEKENGPTQILSNN